MKILIFLLLMSTNLFAETIFFKHEVESEEESIIMVSKVINFEIGKAYVCRVAPYLVISLKSENTEPCLIQTTFHDFGIRPLKININICDDLIRRSYRTSLGSERITYTMMGERTLLRLGLDHFIVEEIDLSQKPDQWKNIQCESI